MYVLINTIITISWFCKHNKSTVILGVWMHYDKNALECVSYSDVMYRYYHVYIRSMYHKVT
jgi:hypothetical protein